MCVCVCGGRRERRKSKLRVTHARSKPVFRLGRDLSFLFFLAGIENGETLSFINEVGGSTFSSVCFMPGWDVSGVSSDNANATRDRHTEMSYTVPDLTGMVSFFFCYVGPSFPGSARECPAAAAR